MATLRQAILDRISDLTSQIAAVRTQMENAIKPLQAGVNAEQAKLGQFGLWLDKDVADVQSEIENVLGEYAAKK